MEALNPYSWMWDESVEAKVKVWLFGSFIVSFGAMAAALWIMIQVYLPPHNHGSQYPGIALTVRFLTYIIEF
jgi:hypothetical protein